MTIDSSSRKASSWPEQFAVLDFSQVDPDRHVTFDSWARNIRRNLASENRMSRFCRSSRPSAAIRRSADISVYLVVEASEPRRETDWL